MSWALGSEAFMGPLAAALNTPPSPLNIQPVDVVRGLKRQQTAASTNFVGCFLLALSFSFFSSFSVSTE